MCRKTVFLSFPVEVSASGDGADTPFEGCSKLANEGVEKWLQHGGPTRSVVKRVRRFVSKWLLLTRSRPMQWMQRPLLDAKLQGVHSKMPIDKPLRAHKARNW